MGKSTAINTIVPSKYYGLSKKQKKKAQKAGSVEIYHQQLNDKKRQRDEDKSMQQNHKKQRIEEELTNVTNINNKAMLERNIHLKKKNSRRELPKKFKAITGT